MLMLGMCKKSQSLKTEESESMEPLLSNQHYIKGQVSRVMRKSK